MENYQFILILKKHADETSPDIEDSDLSEIPDAEWIQTEGMNALQFNRESATFQDAVLSAIKDVNLSSLPLSVERVGQYDIVTKPVIVDRAGISNRRIFEFINGERGPGNFPSPLYQVGVTQFYSWKKVQKWLRENADYDKECSEDDELEEIINTMIQLKKSGAPKEQVDEIWNSLSSIQAES